jgi:hypothetical protein
VRPRSEPFGDDPAFGREEETTMQFLIETLRPAAPANRGRQLALCATLAGVHEIAAELFAGDELALAELEALGGLPEGELRGEPGVLRFAPAA